MDYVVHQTVLFYFDMNVLFEEETKNALRAIPHMSPTHLIAQLSILITNFNFICTSLVPHL